MEYFHSWRDYKTILQRLQHVQGIKRSLPWYLRKLSLKKRGNKVDVATVKAVIVKLLKTVKDIDIFGKHALRDRYKLFVNR